MRLNLSGYVFSLYLITLVLSVVALLINYFLYQFPGNNYFPPQTPLMALVVLLIYAGSRLNFGKNSQWCQSALELFYFFLVMSLIAFATNAVQLTPFSAIDEQIIHFESLFNISIPDMMEWTNKYQPFTFFLTIVYSSLPYQMCFIPLLVIAFGRFNLMREYYFLLILTTLIGFIIYYFFPTTAPASAIKSSLFSPEQIATGYKFKQIHHYISPSTIEGGLIALPSFHTIWALLCVYLLKEWKIARTLLLVINIFLIFSCVLLGWHYPVDVLGALMVLGISYYLLFLVKKHAIS